MYFPFPKWISLAQENKKYAKRDHVWRNSRQLAKNAAKEMLISKLFELYENNEIQGKHKVIPRRRRKFHVFWIITLST